MKIEKINENQILCTLTKEDLEARHIKISELAYGSKKANELFHEMVMQASREYGFQADDIPLMVEAIPARTGNLVLVISKVEYPDELDTRFSCFSETDEESSTEAGGLEEILSTQGASDVLNSSQENKEEDMVCVFEFEHMAGVERLARMLRGSYHGQNDLYKMEKGNGGYFLLMHKSGHTPEQFNRICNISSEYGHQKAFVPAMGAYFEEHSSLIRSGDALQMLAEV